MTNDDRLMLSAVFKFMFRLLFAILYAVAGRKDSELFNDYQRLEMQLSEWHSPTVAVD